MDFVKKHYEKILLSVVLLGLVGALVFLPFLIAKDQQEQREISSMILNPKVVPLEELNLSRQTNVTRRLQSPYVLDLSATNKLFNPLQWQKTPAGIMIPVKSGTIGPEAVVVTKTTPLYLIVALDSIDTNSTPTNASSARYVISVERQAAATPGLRSKRQYYASPGEKVEPFRLLEAKGSLEDPAQLELVLQLTDAPGRVTISKSKPFRRVDGYMADLKYDPEGKRWLSQRVGSVLQFAGDYYNIVAINQDAVILSARSNQKKTTRPYSPQNSE
jgi:hypothetical protein